MYKKYLTIILLILCTFFACTPSNNWITVKSSDSLVSIMLPPQMHSLKGLNNYSTIQYADLEKGLSVLVIADSIEVYNTLVNNYLQNNPDSTTFITAKDFTGYCSMVISNLKATAKKFEISQNIDTIINNMQARLYTYNAQYETDKSYIQLCIFKGDISYYQVFAIIDTKKATENEQIMKRIVCSLNQL